MKSIPEDNSELPKIESRPATESDFIPAATVAIIGLGLMGGSLALALRGWCARLLGVDHNPAVVALALERQVVDQASHDPAVLLPQADLIIIATPVRSSLEILKQLPGLHPTGALVMDLGSTKQAVLQAMAALPQRFDPLGGHPICGKEIGSLVNAEAGLYNQATFAFVRLPRTTRRAQRVALELADLLGARPVWLEAAQHDQWMAATSHMPHLLATALALSVPAESAPLAGPGFRSTSRLAAGSPEMKLDIFATNGPAILMALSQFRRQLEGLEEAVRHHDLDSLQRLLTLGAQRRQGLLAEGK